MTKVRVLCPKAEVGLAVQSLYDFGTIHITQSKTFSASAPMPVFRAYSEKLVSLRSIASALGIEGGKPKEITPEGVAQEWAEIGVEEALTWLKQKNDLIAKLAELEGKEHELAPFQHLRFDPALLKSQRFKAVFFEPLSTWSDLLVRSVSHDIAHVSSGERNFVLLVYDARKAEEVQAIVAEHAGEIIPIPEVEDFAKAYDRVIVQRENLAASLKAVDSLLRRFVQRRGKQVSVLLGSLILASKKAELPSRFGESATLSAVEGWLPSSKLDALENRLIKRLGEHFLLERIQTAETPPTKLDNPRPIRPFEFLVNALSTPKYNELDPTLLVFISFPLFFGMILGDMGYGAIMVLLGLGLRRKFGQGFFRTVGSMLLLSAFWTIVFGYIFGEFLGAEHFFGQQLTPIIHRAGSEGLMKLMQLSLLFGFIHLAIGFVVGAFVAFKEGHNKHALAKVFWLAVLVSMVSWLAAVSNIEALGIFMPLGSILGANWLWGLALSFAGLLWSEGSGALFELPGLLGNLVSYLRIMALGVSGVVLAAMVNQIPLKFSLDPLGIISFVLFALFFILGQAFALALGIFESSIQSLRLHYVEFFSKFYRGGGVPFTPLKDVSNRGEM
ncbi:V-type ATP synthase subunit I [Candidatus Micrarchaeota archaeon]|nr:V-type ATP synthase subunit I [Candidatus Micrarchaeota archaeon]